jgi:hypothetical protein
VLSVLTTESKAFSLVQLGILIGILCMKWQNTFLIAVFDRHCFPIFAINLFGLSIR